MGKKLRRPGQGQFPLISPQIRVDEMEVSIDSDVTEEIVKEEAVSISLKHYQRSCECFGAWQTPELKKFSITVEKVRNYTVDALKTSGLCGMHKGPPSEPRFSVPSDISAETPIYEIRVDQSN